MPHITQAGASDTLVDRDYISPPGVAPQDAINAGMPDQGAPMEEETDEQRRERERREGERENEQVPDPIERPGRDDTEHRGPTSSADTKNDGKAVNKKSAEKSGTR